MKLIRLSLLALSLILGSLSIVWAQETTSKNETATQAAEHDAETSADSETVVIERLRYIQNTLTRKLEERSELGEKIENANEQEQVDLRASAEELNKDIEQLRGTIESIATGGADDSYFTSQPEEQAIETNWQNDLSLIARPVIDSLKDLTEKPRRINELNEQIAAYERALHEAEFALEKLQPKVEATSDTDLSATLDRLTKVWEGRRRDASDSIEIARIELAELQGDKTFFQATLDVLVEFVTGRGFTIVLAILAGACVWYGLQFLLKRYRRGISEGQVSGSRTRYRMIEYSTKAITGILILIAVLMVFYRRGDVLLLGLTILLLFGLALAARTYLPKYVSEARLLLNIGPVREGERVIFRNLPWRVESINMQSILRNPELHGVLRVPLASLDGYLSRPSAHEDWFPTSKGDVVLLDDGTWLEVTAQTPDRVTTAERGGQIRSFPTEDFYQTPLSNLTRSGKFGVELAFGVDYDLQSISTTEVPKAFRHAIREALKDSDLAEFVLDTQVELSLANSSSLDYWIFATFDQRAARSHARIQRLILASCVECCSENGWDIPFQHITLVNKSSDE